MRCKINKTILHRIVTLYTSINQQFTKIYMSYSIKYVIKHAKFFRQFIWKIQKEGLTLGQNINLW
jgi:hypothetical protein